MVRSAASLIGSRGVSATSFSDVLTDSGAPRGSMYLHFPDPMRQLAQDAVEWTSQRVLAYQGGYEGRRGGVLERFIGMWRGVVIGSGGSSGCVVAGVAIDTTEGDESLIDVVRATFDACVSLLSEQFVRRVYRRHAGSVATHARRHRAVVRSIWPGAGSNTNVWSSWPRRPMAARRGYPSAAV